jgi:hypothetical protein
MMRIFFGRGALVVTCLGVMNTAATAADVFTPSLKTYSSASVAAGAIPVPEAPLGFKSDFEFEDGAGAPSTQSWWPLLYSALVPGTGELSMGYEKRGIALIAAEALAWTGYFKNHSEGMDERDEYEAYADAHWTESKWVNDFPNINATSVEDIEEYGQASSGSGVWPGYIPYIPKSQDKQHYYENLGKYDWYISGWDDWVPTTQPYEHDTENRTTYRSMRQKSNNSLDDADSFLWISFAARAFSLAETAIIIHKRRGDAEAGAGGGSPISLRARPRGHTGGEVALEIRW